MLFNSIDFAFFLPVVFFIYWFVTKSLKGQNLFLLFASYFFYGWWDWRFLGLIFASSCIDYFVGNGILSTNRENRKKMLLYVSLTVNLGLLGTLKYFNFFAESFADAFLMIGSKIDTFSLNVILPVGISFYTFQTLSYSIDIYKGGLKPKRDFVSFLAFVSFFPQLVAGPIERASNLLPQFYKSRTFSYEKGMSGMKQILWGLFKKVVIADNCGIYVDNVFDSGEIGTMDASTLWYAAILFAFQIYGDFSGYSDIAIGTAKLFGFSLKRNFNFPYFSRDIAEFWRKWHISLTTWFRDYLYIPLGGSQGRLIITIRNTILIFIVSGFWHGANWTYIVWGALNAFYFMPLLISGSNKKHKGIIAEFSILPSFKEMLLMIFTFILTVFAWIFFRADSVGFAFEYISSMFQFSVFSLPYDLSFKLVVLIVFFFILEWIGRKGEHGLELIHFKGNVYFKWVGYYTISMLIFFFATSSDSFIYFQF